MPPDAPSDSDSYPPDWHEHECPDCDARLDEVPEGLWCAACGLLW